jgi:hypothetical protein
VLGTAPAQPAPAEPGGAPELDRFVGSYGSNVGRIDVEVRAGALYLTSSYPSTWVNDLYADEKPSGSLEHVGGEIFELAAESLYGDQRPRVVFLDRDGDGSPEYLHLAAYAYRRVV